MSADAPFRKVLVANRGEIAVRILRACRDLGISTVAIYSTVDRWSPHVLLADEAYGIGEAAASESYLRGDAIIELARDVGAEAIHPGYGFLAERAHFAEAVTAAGIRFIGPGSAAIAAMGDKTLARQRMRDAEVPIVPGTVEAVRDADDALAAAEEIGFPVLLKAAAGGGGKGMRVVESVDRLARAFDAARREAEAAFGDGAIYVERFLHRPRHVEIQVLADHHGTVIHLGERECSIQRRHQKIVEEAPSPVLTPGLRARMGRAAVRAAEAVGYRNAGTVEFMLSGDEFYFLEMNTRLQVEHPVTELVTGVDLVQWQIRIAAGERLDIARSTVEPAGHAIECRITSENPWEGFLPATGRIDSLQVPAGPGVRWDGGVMEGGSVSLYYDPLLGKLIVHGPDRATAIRRMDRALAELRIVGVQASTALHRRIMQEPDFRAGEFDIGYLDAHPTLLDPAASPADRRIAAIAAALLEDRERKRSSVGRIGPPDASSGRWRDRSWR